MRRAKALGDYLIVGLSTDEFNRDAKHKTCYFPYAHRKELLEALRCVDLVIPEENWEQKRTDMKTYRADIFVMGDDWAGKFDFLREEGVEVVYLPRTPDISSTQIKSDQERPRHTRAEFLTRVPDAWGHLEEHISTTVPGTGFQDGFRKMPVTGRLVAWRSMQAPIGDNGFHGAYTIVRPSWRRTRKGVP